MSQMLYPYVKGPSTHCTWG